jgi:hypothetical protein
MFEAFGFMQERTLQCRKLSQLPSEWTALAVHIRFSESYLFLCYDFAFATCLLTSILSPGQTCTFNIGHRRGLCVEKESPICLSRECRQFCAIYYPFCILSSLREQFLVEHRIFLSGIPQTWHDLECAKFCPPHWILWQWVVSHCPLVIAGLISWRVLGSWETSCSISFSFGVLGLIVFILWKLFPYSA